MTQFERVRSSLKVLSIFLGSDIVIMNLGPPIRDIVFSDNYQWPAVTITCKPGEFVQVLPRNKEVWKPTLANMYPVGSTIDSCIVGFKKVELKIPKEREPRGVVQTGDSLLIDI